MYSDAADSHGPAEEVATNWAAFGHYIRNNIGVAFRCFAGGLFFGLGSTFFMVYNGALLGAVGGFLTERGLGHNFYSFVVTHGAFELTAIVLSGAAGLRIGHALLAPGTADEARQPGAGHARGDADDLRLRGDAADRRGHRGLLVIGALVARWREVRRGRCLLGWRAGLLLPAGPPCRLTPCSCACGRARLWEAADLGIRLAQRGWRELFACHAAVLLPLTALCIATWEIAVWLPLVLLFFSKPWLDRTSLFVLSRAAFGQRTRPQGPVARRGARCCGDSCC